MVEMLLPNYKLIYKLEYMLIMIKIQLSFHGLRRQARLSLASNWSVSNEICVRLNYKDGKQICVL